MTVEYSWVRPATDTFVGRSGVLRDLEARLRRGDSVAIRASRRMGKTSLLLQLDGRLTAALQRRTPGPELCPCFVDLRQVAGRSAATFWADLGEKCVAKLAEQSGIDLPDDLKAATRRLRDELGWSTVLLIDETELLQRVSEYRDLLDSFSTLSSDGHTGSPICQFVFVGGFGLWDLLNEESTSTIATRTSWLILGSLEFQPAVIPDLVACGYQIPVLYQFFNQHSADTGTPQHRRLELLDQFADEARAVFSSWWRSVGTQGQDHLVRWERDGATGVGVPDLETRDRLYGTGLAGSRQSPAIIASEVCRRLVHFGYRAADERDEESDVHQATVRITPTKTLAAAANVDALIITALREEYNQARKVDSGALDDWTVDSGLTGFEVAYRTYDATGRPPLRIALTWATRMRSMATADAAAPLVDKLGARCLAMSGACAGRRGKVHPGDVIIASLVYTYDSGALRTEYDPRGIGASRFQPDPDPYPLDERWRHRAQAFTTIGETCPPSFASWLASRPPTLEAQGDWVLARLHAGDDPKTHADGARICPAWPATVRRLRRLAFVKARSPLALTDKGRRYIDDLLTDHRDSLPVEPPWRIHVAPIATGTNVVRDPRLFDRLSDSMREVLGVEMEAAAIGALAHSRRLPWIVMKGAMDHADDDKDDGFKAFASRASAECLIAFLRSHLESTDRSPPGSARPHK
jgi:nucleoside phosphorylase